MNRYLQTLVLSTTCLPFLVGCHALGPGLDPANTDLQTKLASVPGTLNQSTSLGEGKLELLIESATAAEDRGDYPLAFQQYHQVVGQDPKHFRGNRRLAALHAKRGEPDKAIERFEALLSDHPARTELICDYAYALYLADRFEAADRQLQAALRIDPELMRARGLRGMILARSNDKEQAIHEFTQAGIRQEEIHANLALAMILNGDTESATTSIEAAESLNPSRELSQRLTQYRQAISQAGSSLDAAN